MPTVLPSNQSQQLTILGELQSATFLPWVERHCQRLGLTCETLYRNDGEAAFKIAGQAELIDALEVGCLLGPYDVWVETIKRGPASPY